MYPRDVEILSQLIRDKTRKLNQLAQDLRRLGAALEETLASPSKTSPGGNTNGTQEEDTAGGSADARALVTR